MSVDILAGINPKDSEVEILRKILFARGLEAESDRETFLHPPSPTMPSVRKSLGISQGVLERAVELIKRTIAEGGDIVVYGDYDADGITSTAILWETLHRLGARALPFIPHRRLHGYGLSRKGIDDILSGRAFDKSPLQPFQPKLFVTVDNGIVAEAEVAYLKKKGVRVIISDHHQVDAKAPAADVIVHSTVTSGAGIAWLLALALDSESEEALALIELAAIGIIADQIPLTGINRTIAYHGLKKLQRTTRVGLQALMGSAGIQGKKLSTYDVNFVIAPRLNAMGRMRHGLESLRLLCATSLPKAQELAKQVEQENLLRQEATARATTHAKEVCGPGKLAIVASDTYEEGVIGLVAGKLVEEFYCPAIVISLTDGHAKGSARSIPGFNITSALRQVSSLLESVGGHELAAGFSLSSETVPEFIESIRKVVDASLTPELMVKSYRAEGRLALSQITPQLVTSLAFMEPFGIGNPRPLFLAENLHLLESKRLGSGGKHCKMVVEDNGVTREAIWFNAASVQLGSKVSLLFTPDINVWRGRINVQLVVQALL